LVPHASVFPWDKERCVDDGVTVRCSLVVHLPSCKMLVDNKYSRNV